MSLPLDSPALALRAAIHAALVTDAALVALLGAPRIHDVPPGDADFPFVTLGEAVVADWSTATEAGTEQALTLHVFSRSGGRAEAFAIAARLQAVLHDAALALEGHRLANLRATTAEVRRESDGRTFHALVRFRAVTEPV
ncbi:hypothetical protein GGQ86_002508 [Xanthobacter flavus]|uniref:DUF3168 domain-containing protein n=1 Tax=Xanthobacter flavus TaxID=281 RepID=A0A9W6CLT2_XANFL|nr:DUF3168 domain-containing protein [Xanthobacter flavus]MDR6334032.1 hypothetical protein [Xanthobacter flavus]GLI22750.1 hypothetical protein XFLAVUS301_24240 [Xanthobacter flavus]